MASYSVHTWTGYEKIKDCGKLRDNPVGVKNQVVNTRDEAQALLNAAPYGYIMDMTTFTRVASKLHKTM